MSKPSRPNSLFCSKPHASDKTDDGRARLVRHGHLPEREVIAGIGAVPVKVPRVRDRGAAAEDVRFSLTNLPPYLRKAKSIEELLPWLYVKGISAGFFHEALSALLGPNAAGLSSTTISRLKADWWDEYDRWQRRDLSAAVRLHLGGWRLFPTPNGRGKTIRSGADRGRCVGPQRNHRLG